MIKMQTPKELVICHVIKGDSILLIRPDTGIGKGKWNAPYGEMNAGEKPNKSAIRNVFQKTGLYVNKTFYHGTIRLFLNGKVEYTYKLQLFSTRLFSGDIKPNMEGEARWFKTSEIPYYEMWADDKYWVNLMLQGKKFDADFSSMKRTRMW
jgi:8-oxo-dGTP diphosphatase